MDARTLRRFVTDVNDGMDQRRCDQQDREKVPHGRTIQQLHGFSSGDGGSAVECHSELQPERCALIREAPATRVARCLPEDVSMSRYSILVTLPVEKS